MRKISYFLLLTIILAAGWFGCTIGTDSEDAQLTGVIDVKITIPDFKNHIFPGQNTAVNNRVVDYLTDSITITVSASDMTTVTQTFTSECIISTTGYLPGINTFQCRLTGIPAGINRLIEVNTYDVNSVLLTTGSKVLENTALNKPNSLELALLPAAYTTISEHQTINTAVAYEHTDYYRVEVSTPGIYQIHLTSQTHDVDLYTYNSNGALGFPPLSQTSVPTDEKYLAVVQMPVVYWVAVFGNSATGDNIYTLATSAATSIPLAIGTPLTGSVEVLQDVLYTQQLTSPGIYGTNCNVSSKNFQ